MPKNALEELAAALARNRMAGTCADLPLSLLRSQADGDMVLSAALDAYDNDFEGYSLVGTGPATRRSLGLEAPIFTPIANRARHDTGERIRLPEGMIGAQCELAFTIGKVYPESGEAIDRGSAAKAVVACQPAIGLLGRRAHPGPDMQLAAIADFGLHVATILGAQMEPVDPLDLDKADVKARINGQTVYACEAGADIGHPLDALVWLAKRLTREGKRLNAGDIVTTGSCTPVLQVLPGQQLTVELGKVGTVSCRLD